MARLTFRILSFCVLTSSLTFTQNTPVSDPQAQTIAAHAIAALTGGIVVIDATLAANVTSTAGSDIETGTGVLMASSTTNGRIDLNLSTGKRTNVQNSSTGVPVGAWSMNDGPLKANAQHNYWTDASWFFPALSSLADNKAVVTYVGQENKNGVAVYHLRTTNNNGDPVIQQLSQMDFFLDSASFLPVAVDFNAHLDDNMSVNIPVEITYQNYQPSNGLLVPMHVQRYLQGVIQLDINVTNVSVNSAIPQTEFAVQ
jgi:hypothetical protein